MHIDQDSLLVDERAAREKIAFDTSDVLENSARLQQRFYHVRESRNTVYGMRFFEDTLAIVCKDATVLDYGCFDGRLAPKYESLGAKRIIGIDISERGIGLAKATWGHVAEFQVCDAHNVRMLGDSSVDAIVGRAILHHLNFEQAIREIHRLLRPGGTALFVEPLYDNPASKLFRFLTPHARTKDEKPLSRGQIQWADKHFSSHEHRFCNLVTTPVGLMTSLLPLSPSNLLLNVADLCDRRLERTRMRYWMRLVFLSWKK